MANRIMLNTTSYHGAGAIDEIATEAKAHAFKKAFVCSDPDLTKFIQILKLILLFKMFSTVFRLSKILELIT